MRALATFVSLAVLAGIGAAGYMLIDGANGMAPTSYWCMRALDRADNLDQLRRELVHARTSADKAPHRHQTARYRKRSAKVRNLTARSTHERDEYRSAAGRCRDAR